jgi:hypothetical protein
VHPIAFFLVKEESMFRRSLLLIVIVLLLSQTVPVTHAATIDSLTVTCRRTVATGRIETRAPYVRMQVALASNLNQILATGVFRVGRYQSYTARLSYPRQPEGTLLVVAIGEWDGQRYLRPAALTSQTCWGGGTMPPTYTPTPTAVFPTPPPTFTPVWPTPTAIGPTPTPVWPTPDLPTYTPTAVMPETLAPTFTPDWTPVPPTEVMPTLPPTTVPGSTWHVSGRLTGDTCGYAPQNPVFDVVIQPDGWGNLNLLDVDVWFTLYPAGTHSGYIGQYTLGDASHILDLFFTGPSTFTGYYTVTKPECYWSFEWSGVLAG